MNELVKENPRNNLSMVSFCKELIRFHIQRKRHICNTFKFMGIYYRLYKQACIGAI